MKAKDKPASLADVTRAFAVVQSNVKKLVKLLGDPDDAVSEAVHKSSEQHAAARFALSQLSSSLRKMISPLWTLQTS